MHTKSCHSNTEAEPLPLSTHCEQKPTVQWLESSWKTVDSGWFFISRGFDLEQGGGDQFHPLDIFLITSIVELSILAWTTIKCIELYLHIELEEIDRTIRIIPMEVQRLIKYSFINVERGDVKHYPNPSWIIVRQNKLLRTLLFCQWCYHKTSIGWIPIHAGQGYCWSMCLLNASVQWGSVYHICKYGYFQKMWTLSTFSVRLDNNVKDDDHIVNLSE